MSNINFEGKEREKREEKKTSSTTNHTTINHTHLPKRKRTP
jgi:hypothetical protein